MSYTPWTPNYGQSPAYTPPWQTQRPDMMQGYPQQAQMAPALSQTQMQGFSARPVTSREEAVAAQVDFLGPGTLMPDLKHGAVYLKRFNPDTGACDFLTFTVSQTEPEAPAAPEYATRDDLREMQKVIQGLAADIDALQGRGGKRVADE